MPLRFLSVTCYFLFAPICVLAQGSLERQNDTIEALLAKSEEAYDIYDYKNVIKYGAALVEKGKEYGNDYSSFLGYDILGGAYAELDDTLQGRKYSEKALAIAEAMQSDSLIAWGKLNMGILYSERPQTYQKAIAFFEESIAINAKIGEWDQVYLTYINLAWSHLDHDEADKALAVLEKAKAIDGKSDIDPLDKDYSHLLLGRYHLSKNEYVPAKRQLQMAAKAADRDSITDLALEAYKYLAKAYNGTKEFRNAFESLKAYVQYGDKFFTEEKIEETAKARVKFDLKQTQKILNAALKEKQYSEQLVSKSKSLTTILIAATIILLVALLGFYLFFNARKKYVRQLKIKNKELLTAKENAEKLSKIKTRFLSTVSHELRTPLYGVIGISTLLKDDKNLKAYTDDLESLKFSADYLLALVNDVLLLSKVEAEAITLSQNPFELDFLVQNIVRSFDFSLKKNRIKLHLQIDKDIPNALIGDSIRLSQILINLIGNAVKFNQDGNIWLQLALVKTTNKGLYQTRFSVKDDGPGIPLEKQKIIFEEFSQIEHKNHDYKGTGLGLTIVKKLLKLYKSKIYLESRPGAGSEFSFILNLEENKSPKNIGNPQNGTALNIEDSLKNADLHFLIVDDNRINQKITRKILKNNQIKSSLASDGQQAIDMNRSQKFDLILMDINMPKVNGMEAAKMIRQFDTTIPIIALTAVEMDEIRHEILDSGISDIIHKPYEVPEFLNVILRNLPPKKIDFSTSG